MSNSQAPADSELLALRRAGLALTIWSIRNKRPWHQTMRVYIAYFGALRALEMLQRVRRDCCRRSIHASI